MSTMISVLHSPTKTFEYIRERGGSFVIPLITLMVLAVLSMLLQLPVIENALDAQKVELADSGVDTEMVEQVGKIMAIIFAPIGVAISVFFIGLILLLINLIVRGEATYMQLVKVALLSSIPSAIVSIISGIMIRVTDAESEKDVLFSLGAFFQEKEGFLYGLASIVNPFSLWSLAILIIGAAVMYRRPLQSVGLWIGGIWLAIQLIFALFA